MYISGSLISNIDEGKLNDFLRRKKCRQKEEERGENLNVWVGNALDDGRLDSNDLNEYLFDDLFFGQRRLMRVYKLGSTRKINTDSSWVEMLLERYDIDTLEYNNIICTNVSDSTSDDRIKIAAVKSESDEANGKLVNVKVLFVYSVMVTIDGTDSPSYSYLPVEFRLDEQIFIIKIRNRQYYNTYRTNDDIINDIVDILKKSLKLEIANFNADPQQVLYTMCKGLLAEFFSKIPNIDIIENMRSSIAEFVDALMKSKIYKNIENVQIDGKNYQALSSEIMDLNEEIMLLLQQAITFDFCKESSIDNVCKQMKATLVSVKFTDADNASARVAGENRNRAIFNSKTFLSIRKSIDMAESIVSLSIVFNKTKDKRGKLIIRYDTSDTDFIKIHITNDCFYDEDDFNNIWGVYKKYESESIEEPGELSAASLS